MSKWVRWGGVVSGKADALFGIMLAFVLANTHFMLDQTSARIILQCNPCPQVGAVVVSPTRELARQILTVAQPFVDSVPWLRASLLVGGT